jgi:hypothetical protein
MSTLTAEFDTGEIRPPVGEHTRNLAPFVIGPPAFRRPDVTGEIPIVRPAESGLNILRPAMPAAPLYRRRRGRHRREPSVMPVLLVLVGLWAVGCGAALRLVGAW